MPDIIVTTPKSRMAEAAREAEEVKAAGGGYYYRDYYVPNVPKVDVGDRVYYVEDGYIRGFCRVTRIGRYTRGIRLYMDATTWKWIKPIPVVNSPRSYKYFDLDPARVKLIGRWLDPKPEIAGWHNQDLILAPPYNK